MFCTKCGKKIDYDAIVCNECANGNTFFVNEENSKADTSYLTYQDDNNVEFQEPMTVAKRPKGSRTEGLGGAIGSVIFGFFGSIFSLCGISFVPALIYVLGGKIDYDFLFEILPLFSCGLLFVILSFVNAIKSLWIYKKAEIKPRATRSLGKVGLGFSIVSLCIYAFAVLYAIIGLYV